MCGLLNPSSGTVRLDRREINSLAPYKRARLGMARTFQRLELFALLTVRENVMVAGEVRKNYAAATRSRRSSSASDSRTGSTIASTSSRRARRGSWRSHARSRRGHACCCSTSPHPVSTSSESDELGTLLRSLASEGIAVLLVEHDVHFVMEVCDLIHVLDFGRIIAAGDAQQIRTDEAVLAAYLGGSLEVP